MAYTASGIPASHADGLSAPLRTEFRSIQTAFEALPPFTTTGAFSTIFAQQATVTLTLPATDGTLALDEDLETEITRATGVESAETARATAAEALKAPLASPTFTGAPSLPTGTTATTQAYGTDTTAPATTAFVQAAVLPVAQARSFRNLLDNPQFVIAQRGIGPFSVSGTFVADRWIVFSVLDTIFFRSIAAASFPLVSAEPDTTYWLEMDVSGSSNVTAYTQAVQKIESVRRISGRTVTVSFYASINIGTGRIGLSLDQIFGTGGSPSASVSGVGQSVAINTTPQRYSLTFVLGSLVSKTLGTNGDDYTYLNIWFSAGANNATRSGTVNVQSGVFRVTGLQLEVGSVATPLERVDPTTEFARCERYYQTGQWSIAGYGNSGITVGFSHPLPVTMRTVPTVVATVVTSTNIGSQTVVALDNATVAPRGVVTALGGYIGGGTFTASVGF